MSMRAIAINIGANTNAPGFRGPVYPNGEFEYVPIPESKPTRAQARVPTYGDLDLDSSVPDDIQDTPVHLDPEFAEYPWCERYTYGDEHGVKAKPLSTLSTASDRRRGSHQRSDGIVRDGNVEQTFATNCLPSTYEGVPSISNHAWMLGLT